MGSHSSYTQRLLTATCQKCGQEVQADTLPRLKRRLRNCCKKKGRPAKGVSSSYAGPHLEPGFIAVFDRLVESQNKTTYSHWRAHYDDKKDWYSRILSTFYKYRGIKLPWSHWSLTRIYTGRHRELDYANLVGGAKPLIDSLIDCGIIEDDKRVNFVCDYDQNRGKVNATKLCLLEVRSEPDTS